MKWTIDGIKAGIARIENEQEETITLPVSFLPAGVCEGDILLIQKDKAATEARRKEIEILMESVWKD